MRTTLDLPEALLAEAMEVTASPTKTATIIRALEDLVRKAKISKIKRYRGKVELNIDLDTLRKRS